MPHYALTETGAEIVRCEDDGETVTLCEFTAATMARQAPSVRVRAARRWWDRYYVGAVPPAREHVPRGEITRARVQPWDVVAGL